MNDPGEQGRDLLLSFRDEERCVWHPAIGLSRYDADDLDALRRGGELRARGVVRDRQTAHIMQRLVGSRKLALWRLWAPDGTAMTMILRLPVFKTYGAAMHEIPCALTLCARPVSGAHELQDLREQAT